ncbi:hypothetical protein LCGC14_2659850, partial [marine sediment metagenome]
LEEEIARIFDPAPFERSDLDWDGEGSPVWNHYHRLDVARINYASKKARRVRILLKKRIIGEGR